MLKYRVLNKNTKEDITDKYPGQFWVLTPDGELYRDDKGSFIKDPEAIAVFPEGERILDKIGENKRYIEKMLAELGNYKDPQNLKVLYRGDINDIPEDVLNLRLVAWLRKDGIYICE